MFRASCSRIAARHGSGTRNGGGVDSERGSHLSCSLFQDRKFLSRRTRKLFCSVKPDFESTTESQSLEFFLGAWTIHNFLLVLFNLLLRNKLFLILQFLGNLLRDSFGRIFSSLAILHTALFYLCERDQPIDSVVVALIFGIQAPDWLRKEEYQNFSLPNVSLPRLPQLSWLCWA